MIRKIFIVALSLICVISAGCFEGGSHLIITDDGEVFMRNKLIGNPIVANQIENFKESFANKPNVEISPVAENNMSGYEIRLHYPDMKSFKAENFSLYSAKKGKCRGIQQKNGWFFDAYNFDLIFSGERKLSPSESAAIQSMLSQVTFDLVIELPYSADKNNADKSDVSNKMLTWNLAAALIGGSEKPIRFQFKIWHRDKIFLTVLVEILLIAAGIFFHVKKNSEEDEKFLQSMIFKRNVFAGLSIALAIISAYMILAPVKY